MWISSIADLRHPTVPKYPNTASNLCHGMLTLRKLSYNIYRALLGEDKDKEATQSLPVCKLVLTVPLLCATHEYYYTQDCGIVGNIK